MVPSEDSRMTSPRLLFLTRGSRRGLAALALGCLLLSGGPAPTPAGAGEPTAARYAPGTTPIDAAPSLPKVKSGHRPGPDVLYAAPPRAPQLEKPRSPVPGPAAAGVGH